MPCSICGTRRPGSNLAWSVALQNLRMIPSLTDKKLPHMHLVSKNRYPITNNPSLETIVGYLLEAPKIVRDLQPMQWQFLDAPQDGTLLLTWQPLEHSGTHFASDGYIYGDAEQSFKSDVRGYVCYPDNKGTKFY